MGHLERVGVTTVGTWLGSGVGLRGIAPAPSPTHHTRCSGGWGLPTPCCAEEGQGVGFNESYPFQMSRGA